ncbi:MAG TPA: DUF4199 domain-containing protein [Bacteroidetes bacterium]|nr:DUF4199 domain-containing protein [Bacteroidota bacterium]
MKKNILIYGLIAGALVSGFMLYTMNNLSHCEGSVDYNTSMFIGYASMLIAFCLVFVGIRNYRNNYNGGIITFGKSFKIGIMIVLIASTIYVVSWLIDYYWFIPDFAEKYSANMLNEMRNSGATADEIQKQSQELESMSTILNNPFLNALVTYTEILPIGLVVTVISSLILKRKSSN